jgi:hypothetical protein
VVLRRTNFARFWANHFIGLPTWKLTIDTLRWPPSGTRGKLISGVWKIVIWFNCWMDSMLKLNATTTHETKTAAEQLYLLCGTDVSVICCCCWWWCCHYVTDLMKTRWKVFKGIQLQLTAKIMNAVTEKKNKNGVRL